MVSVKFSATEVQNKRMKAIFYNEDGKKKKTVSFGYKGGSTFIEHRSQDKKNAWIARHSVRGSFDIYDTPSALARWILWNHETLSASIASYKKRFNLK